jgi:hypothetical protein
MGLMVAYQKDMLTGERHIFKYPFGRRLAPHLKFVGKKSEVACLAIFFAVCYWHMLITEGEKGQAELLKQV